MPRLAVAAEKLEHRALGRASSAVQILHTKVSLARVLLSRSSKFGLKCSLARVFPINPVNIKVSRGDFDIVVGGAKFGFGIFLNKCGLSKLHFCRWLRWARLSPTPAATAAGSFSRAGQRFARGLTLKGRLRRTALERLIPIKLGRSLVILAHRVVNSFRRRRKLLEGRNVA